MTRKRRRLILVLVVLFSLSAALALALLALRDNLDFFYSPTDLIEHPIQTSRPFRLGGLVEQESVSRSADGLTITFRITDNRNAVTVTFTGIVPDLFREGQGVVARGRLSEDRTLFTATEILTKHDENYMPPDVRRALEEDKNRHRRSD
ncbi:MAG: cytochrome c maturation protein CcmE [Pseudomonadota bacterium]|nr:cytochrome c maturation protein CcmE [Pseudomonadota bacterium]